MSTVKMIQIEITKPTKDLRAGRGNKQFQPGRTIRGEASTLQVFLDKKVAKEVGIQKESGLHTTQQIEEALKKEEK